MAVTTATGQRGWGMGNPATARPAWAHARPLPEAVVANPPQVNVRRPKELRNTVAMLFAIMLISIISLLYMNQAGRLATSGYQISQLQAERDRLQRENQGLEVQLSQLHSLPYVEDTATNKLHMVKGDLAKVQYVSLDAQQLAAAR
ncbi:MAG: cell division protein FtsL [Chloroflexi bacterium]|nr:cell division protein FtsL [Chloroflexota bacterium]